MINLILYSLINFLIKKNEFVKLIFTSKIFFKSKMDFPKPEKKNF